MDTKKLSHRFKEIERWLTQNTDKRGSVAYEKLWEERVKIKKQLGEDTFISVNKKKPRKTKETIIWKRK